MVTISLSRTSLSPPLSNSSTSLTNLKPPTLFHRRNESKSSTQRGIKCSAELSHEAPIVAAIGACVITSLVFPVSTKTEEDDDDDDNSGMDSTDIRFGVMGIISFIPYFNWLGWIFAWLDTGKKQYAIYALVYLAPYLSSNLSLSPEDSWLPIFSILICIIHIQLEASIRNGDLQQFQIFNEVSKHFPTSMREKDTDFENHKKISNEMNRRKNEYKKLPSADELRRRGAENLGVRRKPFEKHSNEDREKDKNEDK